MDITFTARNVTDKKDKTDNGKMELVEFV